MEKTESEFARLGKEAAWYRQESEVLQARVAQLEQSKAKAGRGRGAL